MKNQNVGTALITGASSGFGVEFARLHAERGGDVILVARSEGKLKKIAGELESKFDIAAHVIVKDLAKEDSAEELYSEVESKGIQVDYLFNNAGFGETGDFLDIDLDRQVNMIDLNMRTLTELTYLFGKPMVDRGEGWVLNVASTAAFQPGPGMGVYFATKAYVLSFTEALAEEWKQTGLKVTALCPGPTETGFAKAAHASSSKIFSGQLPTARMVAEYGYKSLMKGRVVAVHGFRNRMILLVNRVSPRSVVRKVVKGMVK